MVRNNVSDRLKQFAINFSLIQKNLKMGPTIGKPLFGNRLEPTIIFTIVF